jgi:hypothetical protein
MRYQGSIKFMFRLYVEVPKPSRVELTCSQNPRPIAEGFDVILATPERVWYLNILDPMPRV